MYNDFPIGLLLKGADKSRAVSRCVVTDLSKYTHHVHKITASALGIDDSLSFYA